MATAALLALPAALPPTPCSPLPRCCAFETRFMHSPRHPSAFGSHVQPFRGRRTKQTSGSPSKLKGSSELRTSASTVQVLPSSNEEKGRIPEPCDALIVGGGPAGLAAAWMLSRRSGWDRIVVLEKHMSVDYEDLDRSYVYRIDGRGKKWMDEVRVTDDVVSAGLPNSLGLQSILPDGTVVVKNINTASDNIFGVWLPRRAFLQVLYKKLLASEGSEKIQILNGTCATCIRIHGHNDSSEQQDAITVYASDVDTGSERAFSPRLLLGCDGMNSTVRNSLHHWADAERLEKDWFSPVAFDSPSVGLRYKVLQLPPNAPFRKKQSSSSSSNGSPSGSHSHERTNEGAQCGLYVTAGTLPQSNFGKVVGIKAPSNRKLALGLLPLKDEKTPRLANIILKPDHEFWKVSNGQELQEFLQESFPQLDIAGLLSPEKLEAAARSPGGVFPKVQHLRHFTAVVSLPPPSILREEVDAAAQTVSSGSITSSQKSTTAAAAAGAAARGVVLLGDALHSFPPDLGQGVNSALEDVMVFFEAMDECEDNLAEALPLFEQRRAPECAALSELMTFSAPYQYGQDAFGAGLWLANLLLRSLVSKIAPAWAGLHTHSALLLQDVSLPYTEVMRRAQQTTARLKAMAAAFIAIVALAVLRLAF